MSCYGCGTTFGLFKKEHGCKNCGFAFCTSCLNKKLPIPKLNNEKHHVCNKCYNILTGKVKPAADDSGKYSPPEAYKKRIAALEEREKNDGHSKGHRKPVHPENKHHGKPEREIQERLHKLQEGHHANIPSQKEIEGRLANLKGLDHTSTSQAKKPVFQAPDRRTQQEQINSLLDEISDEIEIDSHRPDPVKDIEQRLAGLRDTQEPVKPSNNLNRENSQDTVPYEKNINNQPSRTNDEIPLDEMQRLIEEASKELDVDAQKALEDLQKDKEIMKKLQEIKDRKKEDINKDDKSVEETSDSDNENEETLTRNLIKQILEENKLDEAAAEDGIDVESNKNSSGQKNKKTLQKKDKKIQNVEPDKQKQSDEDSDYDDDDELPYCVMCTEDAAIRCHGCDLDLYCDKCWKESHLEFEMGDHETSKYRPRKGKT